MVTAQPHCALGLPSSRAAGERAGGAGSDDLEPGACNGKQDQLRRQALLQGDEFGSRELAYSWPNLSAMNGSSRSTNRKWISAKKAGTTAKRHQAAEQQRPAQQAQHQAQVHGVAGERERATGDHRRGLTEGQHGRAGALERPLTGDGQRKPGDDRQQPQPASWPMHELWPRQAEVQEQHQQAVSLLGPRCPLLTKPASTEGSCTLDLDQGHVRMARARASCRRAAGAEVEINFPPFIVGPTRVRAMGRRGAASFCVLALVLRRGEWTRCPDRYCVRVDIAAGVQLRCGGRNLPQVPLLSYSRGTKWKRTYGSGHDEHIAASSEGARPIAWGRDLRPWSGRRGTRHLAAR